MSVNKYPLKRLEVAIRNNVQVAIPLYIKLLSEQSARLREFRTNKQWDLFQKEQVKASSTVKQLRCALEELNKLKYQVIESDLGKLEREIEPTRKSVQDAIEKFNSASGDLSDPLFDLDGIPASQECFEHQVTENLDIASDITEKRDILQSWEVLRQDLQDLNSVVHTVAQTVREQQTAVNTIENHVEAAETNVREGTKELSKAAALKGAMVPVAGALVGGMMGGPVGLYAGMKLGTAVFAIGTMMGFFGGKVVQKLTQSTNEYELQTLNSTPKKEK